MNDQARQELREHLAILRKSPVNYRTNLIEMGIVTGMLAAVNALTGSAWALVESECLQEHYACNEATGERIAATKWLEDQGGERK